VSNILGEGVSGRHTGAVLAAEDPVPVRRICFRVQRRNDGAGVGQRVHPIRRVTNRVLYATLVRPRHDKRVEPLAGSERDARPLVGDRDDELGDELSALVADRKDETKLEVDRGVNKAAQRDAGRLISYIFYRGVDETYP
jgi:hypothetical protein